MDTFLRETKDCLESARGHTSLNVHVVLSNESCDLDSAISALVWAYHLAKEQEVPGTRGDVVIPVLNIPFEDYHLRTEVTHFLSLVHHIGASSLVFRDDVDLHSQHAAGRLTLTLVDHNTLPPRDAVLDEAVREVIDHHSNGRHNDGKRDIQVTVEPVGSCSTLIAEKVLARNPDIVNEDIAKLLLGPILVDTVNLSASACKATTKDIAMVEALSEICPDLNKEEMYQELQEAKADMSDFSVTDILRKDFKCVSGSSMSIGMSSILMHLTEFVDKPDIETGFQDFCSLKNLRLLVLMALTVSDDGKAHRQICVYSPNSSDSMKDELIQTLEESTSPELSLSELATNASGLVVYNQANVKASRKRVLPLVKDFLSSQEDSSLDEEQETEEGVATELDLTDMNDTLLKLSTKANNANNANEQVSSDDPFGIGDSQVISSPDSSGIDAGSVLLDLDPFSGNQDAAGTSLSGAFSSRDSMDTLGITPSSPSSDVMGFGSESEDLLGLDNFGSAQQSATEDLGIVNPPSNPFAASATGDDTGLEAFMSQPVVPLDSSSVSNTSNDLFSFDAVPDSEAAVLESTVSASSNNPFADARESSSGDLLGLDLFSSSVSEAPGATDIAVGNPFAVTDSTVQTSVSTTLESSETDLGDFMNQLPGSPDAVDQQLSDPSSDIHMEVAVDSSDGVQGTINDNPFGIRAVTSPSEFTDQSSDSFTAESANPFKLTEPSTETSTSTTVESSARSFSAVTDYHPGSPGSGVAEKPSNLLESDLHSGSSGVLDEPPASMIMEGASSNVFYHSDIQTDQCDSQAQELLHPAPDITISQSSDIDQETSETEDAILDKKEEQVSDDSPSDENQDVNNEVVATEAQDQQFGEEPSEYEGLHKTEKVELDKGDQRNELEEGISPKFDLGTKIIDGIVGDGQRAASEESEDEFPSELKKTDLAEADLNEMSAGSSPEDVPSAESISVSVTPDQEQVDNPPPEFLDEKESLVESGSPKDSMAAMTAEEVQQSLWVEEDQEEPSVTFDEDEMEGPHKVGSDVVETSFEVSAESTVQDMHLEVDQSHNYQVEELKDTEELSGAIQDEPGEEKVEVVADSAQEVQESEESHDSFAKSAVSETLIADASILQASLLQFDTAKEEEIVSSQTVDQMELVPGSVDEILSPESPVVQNVQENDRLTVNRVDDAGDDFQEKEEGGEGDISLSEERSTVLDYQSNKEFETEVHAHAPHPEVEKEEEILIPVSTDLLESVPDVMDKASAPESSTTPDVLPLDLSVGAAASLEQNFSPVSDEGPARSSGITSPDSEFTSDAISEDPSSGDSYVVTDLSHEVSNFQIGDIQEEVEEEENQLGESKGDMGAGAPVGEVEVLEKQVNGIPSLTAPEDFSGEGQVGVIDNYYAEETTTDRGVMDTIPIPTDVGFASSGRSSPQNALEGADSGLLQEEAHDLVQAAIKMAKFAFLEEKQQETLKSPGEIHAEAPDEQLVSAAEVEDVIQSSEATEQESALPSSEVSVSVEARAEGLTDGTEDHLESLGKGQNVLGPEAPKEVSVEPPQFPVEEEIPQVMVSQEESQMKVNKELPLQEHPSAEEGEGLPTDQNVLPQADSPLEEELIARSEMPTEQGVPHEADQESQESVQQLEEKHPLSLSITADMEPKDEIEEAPQSPIEVNVVISKQGLQDISSNSEEVTSQSTTGKTKLTVEDSMKDVDIEIESDNQQTSVFGLADILEYVNPDGKVESSTADPHIRPSTLPLTTKSTPKSARLLSSGTPISMLSDTGTPLTPISLRSLDMLTSDTGTDEDTLDRMEEGEAETGKPSERMSPPPAKRCLSIDADVVQDIHGEWDDSKKLMEVIVEKERTKSLIENQERKSPQRTMSVATAQAKKNMEGVELPDEWQDDEFAQQKLAGVDSQQEEDSFFKRRVPPKDSKLGTRHSMLSDDGSVEGMSAWAERLAGDDDFDEEDMDESPLPDDTLQSPGVEPIPEYTAQEEMEDRRNWRKVVIANKEFTLDMRAINPYKKVLSHGGYYGDGVNAIIVLASCYMPDRSRKDYNYIMNNLFLYVISTLELLVANEYMIVYFHGAAPKNRIPSLNWMRKCYQMIDRKLRKNLKGLYIVHPTTWLRTIIRFTRPFISSKFSRKLKFVETLDELSNLVSMEYIYVPDEVRRFDEHKKQKEGGGVALWGWINSRRGTDGSSEGGSSCYTKGPDSDIATLDEDYIDEMLFVPTSRAARRRMSAQLRRGNFALSALQQERANDFEDDWDSHGFMEDDMFADIEDDDDDDDRMDGDKGQEETPREEAEADEEEELDLKHRRSVGDQDLEYEEEMDPLSALHAPPYHSSPSPHSQREPSHQNPPRPSEADAADTRRPVSSLRRSGVPKHVEHSGKR
ncbi:protein prune homolog 2-like isoform X3 [Acanthaster planci]|uniref:Protein prune homolog 2-like isoform X3 n=1 Tax=Acanthaster planci TaxID=133434 RepID=A0A8B7YC01_ACAPL|nr:protein prune homolog 2-like isoform X3 [Acanthaster planci]